MRLDKTIKFQRLSWQDLRWCAIDTRLGGICNTREVADALWKGVPSDYPLVFGNQVPCGADVVLAALLDRKKEIDCAIWIGSERGFQNASRLTHARYCGNPDARPSLAEFLGCYFDTREGKQLAKELGLPATVTPERVRAAVQSLKDEFDQENATCVRRRKVSGKGGYGQTAHYDTLPRPLKSISIIAVK